LVAPLQAAIQTGKPYHLILEAIIAGISFRAKDENGNYLPSDVAFFEEAQKGTQNVLENVCAIIKKNHKN
jgi:mannitol-1-phosphate 5-dehydrogenase